MTKKSTITFRLTDDEFERLHVAIAADYDGQVVPSVSAWLRSNIERWIAIRTPAKPARKGK